MLRALIWKEWREQRQVAAAGIGMAVLLPAVVFAVAVSAVPDGHLGDIADMILRAVSLDGNEDRRVLPGVTCSSGRVAISPDGGKIATIAGAWLSIGSHRHFVIDVEDGVARRLEEPLTGWVHEWLDEDRLVVRRGLSREQSISLLDVVTGDVEVIAGVGR